MYEDRTYSTGLGISTSGTVASAIGIQPQVTRDPQITSELQQLQKLIEEHNVICANLQQRLQPVLCVRPAAGAEANQLAETLTGCNQQLYGLLETYRGILASLEI